MTKTYANLTKIKEKQGKTEEKHNVLSITKYSSSYPHLITSIVASNKIIMSHTPTSDTEIIIIIKEFLFYLFIEIISSSEVFFQDINIFSICCHCHNSTNTDMGHFLPFSISKQLSALTDRESSLCRFPCHMYFKKHINLPVIYCRTLLNFSKQLKGIHRLYYIYIWYSQLYNKRMDKGRTTIRAPWPRSKSRPSRQGTYRPGCGLAPWSWLRGN